MLRLVLLTFLTTSPVVVIAQVPVATSTSSPVNSASAPDLSKMDIPMVGFCELVSHPDKYDNQIIRTQAIIYYGFEASVLYHANCDRFDTWAAYDSSYDGKTKQSKKLYKMLTKGENGDYNSAQVTIVGRFLGKKQVAYRIKDKAYYMGYGHKHVRLSTDHHAARRCDGNAARCGSTLTLFAVAQQLVGLERRNPKCSDA